MNLFTYGFAEVPLGLAWRSMYGQALRVPGLVHAELLWQMELGSPILSRRRMQLGQLAMFAAWEGPEAIDAFLAGDSLGRHFQAGWHVRMKFLRRWGLISEFDGLSQVAGEADPEAPVVAVTLARMRLLQVPRFLRWGRPVEAFVRDHPGVLHASAAMRLPRSIATFSVWARPQDMLDMVHGRGRIEHPHLHAAAMRERERQDFHHQFTTLRFQPLEEQGSWHGRSTFLSP
ncbi:MAG: hypothetical protein RL095_3216 [Verrucomicrobiota bacterium]|jgi:hypothetical protein